MKKDIENLNDIQLLVDEFYTKVRANETLGLIFKNIIKNNWSAHLQKMYKFWQTVLLDEHTYYGSPFGPHANMPIGAHHFEQWLLLFKATLRENFEGPKADEAAMRAEKMAAMFLHKINYYRENKSKPLM